jgi:regulator of protease activity HflC (stomatin/prohibitin superfamily)
MLTTIHVKLDERAVVLQDGLPVRALGPGKHRLWGFGFTALHFPLEKLVFEALPEVRAVLPDPWYEEITVGVAERAIVSIDGKPKAFLRPGTHRVWKTDESLLVQMLSTREPMPVLTKELVALVPRDEYADVLVREHERGLLFVQGKLTRTLAPGRYTFWSAPEEKVDVTNVDMRLQQVLLAPQELMTKDKVSLRVTLTVEYVVTDPVLATTSVAQPRDTIYLLAQMASREYVAAVTLDELLAGRDAMTRALEGEVVPKATTLGVRVDRVGVKDIVLPGEMKTLLNRVIEAEKEAAANVILRREETAATRSLANTAKVLAENPVLLRLKELEALKEIASNIEEVRVIVGADGIKTLLPVGLLSETTSRGV